MTHRLRYIDASGDEHHLRLECSPEGRWRVLDVAAHGTMLVEELGPDDQRPQAEALARDYVAQAERAVRIAGGEDDGDVVWAA